MTNRVDPNTDFCSFMAYARKVVKEPEDLFEGEYELECGHKINQKDMHCSWLGSCPGCHTTLIRCPECLEELT